MSAKYARFIANPHARAAEERKAEEVASPKQMAKAVAPALVAKLDLVEMGDRWIGQCPACASEGSDSKGDHLVVWPDGRWGCVVHKGEEGKDHRSLMAMLCPPLRGKRGKWIGYERPDLSAEKGAVTKLHGVLWQVVRASLAGGIESLGPAKGIDPDPGWQFGAWCSLWQAGETAWAGTMYDKGEDFQSHLFQPANPESRAAMWEKVITGRLDVASGLIWHAGATSRKNTPHNLKGVRFLVVEHDYEDLAGQVALIRYARDILRWKLRMIVATGGKGIHGLFDAPADLAQMTRDAHTLIGLGADPQSLNRSATRIPGAIRPETGKPQQIVWMA